MLPTPDVESSAKETQSNMRANGQLGGEADGARVDCMIDWCQAGRAFPSI